MTRLNISALVEFLEPSEARIAFMKLAYTKFKHLPLYLEWAPDNSFKSPPKRENQTSLLTPNYKAESEASSLPNEDETSLKAPQESSSEDEEEPEPDTTLFVKNVNFSTTDDMLKEVRSSDCDNLRLDIHFQFLVLYSISEKLGACIT